MRKNLPNIVVSLALILAGVVFLAQNLGYVQVNASMIWSSFFGGMSLLFFVSYFVSGLRSWGNNIFIEKLREANIGTSVHFIPAHLHPYYKKRFGFKPSDFPVATKLYNQSLSLPIYPKMQLRDVRYVSDKVKEIANKYKR